MPAVGTAAMQTESTDLPRSSVMPKPITITLAPAFMIAKLADGKALTRWQQNTPAGASLPR